MFYSCANGRFLAVIVLTYKPPQAQFSLYDYVNNSGIFS